MCGGVGGGRDRMVGRWSEVILRVGVEEGSFAIHGRVIKERQD